MYDLILRNGMIVDGSGNCWFVGDIGIKAGRIREIGRLEGDANTILDVSDLVVCPGFIDIHSHSDITPLVNPKSESKIIQGAWSSPVKDTGWDRIVNGAVRAEEDKDMEGMSLTDIASSRSEDVFDVFFEILTKENGRVNCIYHEMCEYDVKTVLSNPITMIGSDGRSLSPEGVLGKGKPHPRNYGTFPRVLAKYVREKHLLALEEAIRKMTSFPAQKLGLRDRGMLREGLWADVVVFSPLEVQDTATYDGPARFPVGMKYVIVNGEVVVSEDRHTGATPGRLLKAA